MYKEVGFENKADMVFLAVFTKESKPYRNYEEMGHLKEKNFPRVLLIDRWDGKKGFLGGFMDKGKNERDTLKAEFEEEIGFDQEIIDRIETDAEVFSCVKTGSGKIIKCYKLEVSEAKIFELRNDIVGLHHDSEITGKDIIQIHGNNVLLKDFAKDIMAGSSHQELLKLVKEEKLLEISNIEL